MVRDVNRDSRGLISPRQGLKKFRLERLPPSTAVGAYVDRFWLASWDLPVGQSYEQRVLSHPVVNLVFRDGQASVHGVMNGVTGRRLEGRGRVLGIMFRPAGFRPLISGPMSSLRNQERPAVEMLGPEVGDLARRVAHLKPKDAVVAAESFLAERLPEQHPCQETMAVVETVVGDRSITSVRHLASLWSVTPRQLERRFADHVGATPKAVIRRYRLYEVAERVQYNARINWAALASELGYSDQSHLVRDFRSLMGAAPAEYLKAEGPPRMDPERQSSQSQ